MTAKIFLRNSTQYVLIKIIKLLRPILDLKIILFSRFMASDRVKILIKESVGTYILHTKDIGVARRIYIGMNDEYLKLIKAIEWTQRLRGGGGYKPMLLDIGANIGHVSIPLVLGKFVSKAVAIEPDPDNYKLLKCNVILNGLEDYIFLHNLALGSLPNETLEFELSEDNYGDHRIKVSKDQGLYQEADRKVLQVKSTNLDSLIASGERTSDMFICIDVQGYEGAVLVGAPLLLKNKPAIGLEFWPYGLNRAKTFDDLMTSLSRYDFFYDLSKEQPIETPIEKLKEMYEINIMNDSFTKDILVV
jgi:FkbM family methyltransferase